MQHVLIILSNLDIPGAASMAARLRSCRAVCFDPCLVDELHAGGLADAEYLDFPGGPAFPDMHNGAREEALAIERELLDVAQHLLPGVTNFSWLHLNWYYLLIACRWYGPLGQYIAANKQALFGAAKPVVFINDNPAMFFWPSFVPALNVLEALARAGIEFDAFTYEQRADETGVMPMLVELGEQRGQRWDLLTHLPTCMHDVPLLNEELAASGRRVINLKSKYWDVPVSAAHHDMGLARTQDLKHRLTEASQAALGELLERMRGVIDARLSTHIPSESHRARQAEQLVRLYDGQFVTYWLLKEYFDGRPPRKMLLCDHDAGFHGPLVSYAQVQNIPVLFFPHSKTIADIQFGAQHVSCLTHPIQGEPLNDATGQRVKVYPMAFAETLTCSTATPPGLRKIGLLLNSVSLNGVMVSHWAPYIQGVRDIAEWCRARGIELDVRCRPGHTLFQQVGAATGIAAETLAAGLRRPLSDFVAGIDLCLMYDAPTTAELELLRNNVPLLNPVPEPLAKYEAVIANTAVIPRAPVAEILFRLDGMVSDPANLHAFQLDTGNRHI